MEKNRHKSGGIIKWLMFYSLALWGFISFLFLAGEKAPDCDMTFGQFCLLKFTAMASLLLCCLVGKILHRAGMLPEKLDEDETV